MIYLSRLKIQSEKDQIVTSNVWLQLDWVDVNLRWNESEYGGIKDLRIPPAKIWTPDVLMYNSADEKFDGTFHTNVILLSNGSLSWVPPGIFKSTCKIDIQWFPFDDQKCSLKFGSWTYDQGALDLRLKSPEGGDLSSFITNGEWTLLGMPATRNELHYACCPDPYIDVTFVIHIRRRTLYYGFNLIIPCVLISSMSLLGFTLPPDSGEKLTLGVTILLSLMVFLQLVAETMPNTSEAVSLIGAYFACIMIMVAFSVVMTVLVLNCHHRNSETHTMPKWVKTVLLQWLPWILRMDRPNKKITRKTIAFSAKMKELEMKERSSKSLLANVLDIDDDFRHVNNAQNMPTGMSSDVNNTCGFLGLQGGGGGIEDPASAVNGCYVAHRELIAILKELRYITNHMRDKDDADEISNDWKFCAMVIDRLCLILFTVFTIISTCTCILRADVFA
ncbi:CHRNA7 (predicted) [Pycnogonum litorale]